jgi:hypothetical protein
MPVLKYWKHWIAPVPKYWTIPKSFKTGDIKIVTEM